MAEDEVTKKEPAAKAFVTEGLTVTDLLVQYLRENPGRRNSPTVTAFVGWCEWITGAGRQRAKLKADAIEPGTSGAPVDPSLMRDLE